MNVSEVKGHWCRSTYDGRIKYERGMEPDVIVVNGRTYKYVPETDDARHVQATRTNMVTPEDGMRRETRGPAV